MKASSVVGYYRYFELADVPDPEISSLLDVIMAIKAAGICRTDIHIQEGQWAEKSNVKLPYTFEHENAGVIHKVGDAVKHLRPAEKPIPGINTDGGYAEYLKTNARIVIKLDDFLEPADVAALADVGLTANHAVAKVAPTSRPGSVIVCIGADELGHIGIQCLRAFNSSAVVVVIDRNADALALAKKLGVDHTIQATDDGNSAKEAVKFTDANGVEAAIDFVAEGGSTKTGIKMLRRAGNYCVVGYGENLDVPTIDIISTEINFIGNLVGSYNGLADLMVLAAQGKVKLHTASYKLDDFQKAIYDLSGGKVRGRAILVP